MLIIVFGVFFRHGEHPICIRSSKRHHLTVESERIQLGLMGAMPTHAQVSLMAAILYHVKVSFILMTLTTRCHCGQCRSRVTCCILPHAGAGASYTHSPSTYTWTTATASIILLLFQQNTKHQVFEMWFWSLARHRASKPIILLGVDEAV